MSSVDMLQRLPSVGVLPFRIGIIGEDELVGQLPARWNRIWHGWWYAPPGGAETCGVCFPAHRWWVPSRKLPSCLR